MKGGNVSRYTIPDDSFVLIYAIVEYLFSPFSVEINAIGFRKDSQCHSTLHSMRKPLAIHDVVGRIHYISICED